MYAIRLNTDPDVKPMKDNNDLTRILSYTGYVLVAHEIMKSMIVRPIKAFYENTTFQGGPFKSYEQDVLFRSKNEFEACLLYLKDFMEAIDQSDIQTIQALRKHRNDLAHNLHERIDVKHIEDNSDLLTNVKGVIFKISNYRAYMEIGREPELKEINWSSMKGHEFLIIENIINNVKLLK